jgi:hypothetical protein
VGRSLPSSWAVGVKRFSTLLHSRSPHRACPPSVDIHFDIFPNTSIVLIDVHLGTTSSIGNRINFDRHLWHWYLDCQLNDFQYCVGMHASSEDQIRALVGANRRSKPRSSIPIVTECQFRRCKTKLDHEPCQTFDGGVDARNRNDAVSRLFALIEAFRNLLCVSGRSWYSTELLLVS